MTMPMDEVIEFVEALDGVYVLRPGPGDGSPEISWGDVFFYYAPDGVITSAQPFATIVTKDYPGEDSQLDRPGAYRVNVAAGSEEFLRWTGRRPRDAVDSDIDPSTPDLVMAHPTYGSLGWLAVIDPGENTATAIRALLRTAHERARARYQRRAEAH